MNTNTNRIKQWQEQEALSRFQLIAPLLQEDLDDAKRLQLRKQIAQDNDISVRSIYRYEKAYREGQFAGLKPAAREKRRSQKLPENFDLLLEQAIQLRKEVPERSVAQIICILELEGRLCCTGSPETLHSGTAPVPGWLRKGTDADVPRCAGKFFQTFLQTAPYDAGTGGYQVRSETSDWEKWRQSTDVSFLRNR